MLPAPSADTLPFSGPSRQPNMSSGSIWPMTCRAVTARGRFGSRIESSGALTFTTLSEPAFFNALARRTGWGVLVNLDSVVVTAINRGHRD